MAENVILLVRPGPVHWQRQAAACQPYFDERGYVLVAVAESHPSAVALVINGAAKVVVAARSAADDWRLEALLRAAKGKLKIAHPSPAHGPERAANGHDTEEIVARMAIHGGTTGEIVRLLGVAEERVRAIIDRVRGRR